MAEPRTPDRSDAEKMRRLAEVMRAEKAVYTATRRALDAWLPLVTEAVLYGRGPSAPITASLPEPLAAAAVLAAANPDQDNPDAVPLLLNPANAELARAAWAIQSQAVLDALAATWTAQFARSAPGTPPVTTQAFRDAYLAKVSNRIVGVPDELFAKVAVVVRDATLSGKSIPQVAQDVRTVLSTAANLPRAVRIARTETVAAYNAGALSGTQLTASATGEILFKEWLSTPDTRTRETHQHQPIGAGGQTRPIAEAFVVGGAHGQFPGDPTLPAQEAVNCRCTLIFGTKDELGVAVNQPLVADAATATLADRGLPNGWRGPIAGPLDALTGDRRILATPPGGLRTREYPMSFTRKHVGEDDIFIGTIDRAWVQDGLLYGEGAWDLGGVDGAEAARLVGEAMLRNVSIDPDEVTVEFRFYDADGNEVAIEDALVPVDDAQGAALGDMRLRDGVSEVMVMTDWRLSGVALVSIQAYDEARIEAVWDYVPTPAQPDNSGSSMIALRIQDPQAYALPGGLSPDDLHITLHYLGDAADLADAAVTAASGAALAAAHQVRSRKRRKVHVAGYGVLGASEPPATVLFLNGGGIADAHAAAAANLGDFGWEAYPAPHEPFLAHMTLGYGLDPALAAPFVGAELDIDTVSFDHGTFRVDYTVFDEAELADAELDPSTEPVVAAVTGATNLPVSTNRKLKWDGSKAGVALQKHYTTGGKTDWAAISRAYLFRDPNGPADSIDAFKLPYATIIDGTLTIVPNGVIGLAGGHGVTAISGVSDAERSAMKRKLCTLYAKVRTVHGDFPDCPFQDTKAALVPDPESLVAASGQVFRREVFDDPVFEGPTALTVDPETGYVRGHVRVFGTCYLSSPAMDVCLEPPPSATNYARFHVHGARLDDGSILPVGALTFGEGHRAHGGLKASQAAYANVATIAAKVRAGEDEFGVWVSGQVLDEFRERADDLLLSPLSGHWEPDPDNRGHLEMIAAHIVVTPGYAVRRIVATIEDGEATSLIVAAPRVPRQRTPEPLQSARALAVLKRLGMDNETRVSRMLAMVGLGQ